MFWLLACGLVALAIGFIVVPLLRSPQGAAGGRRAERGPTARSLYRQRWRELDDEARAGVLEADERAEMEEELGQTLLSEWVAETPKGQPAETASAGGGVTNHQAAEAAPEADQAHWAWLLAGLAALVASLGCYWMLGEPQAQALADAAVILDAKPDQQPRAFERRRAFLSDRVQTHPEDAGSWFLLGQAHMQDADFTAAASAFERASGLVEDDANLDLHWLQALYRAGGGQLDEAGLRFARRILERQPNQSVVLLILAVEAHRRKHFRAAVGYFNRALANPQAPGLASGLQAGIDLARAQLGAQGPTIDVAAKAVEPPPQGATLFVIARPVGGGMPYAVVRRPAFLLPRTFRLDDFVSMNSAAPLSQAETVEVIARISLTGAATPQPGDWEWRSGPLAIGEAQAPIALQATLGPPAS